MAKQENPVMVFRSDLERFMPSVNNILPPHISPDKFRSAVMTAVNLNPDLAVKATRTSVFTSCMKAAADGLVPDGREGAIVLFGNEAQWLPMVQGVIKRMRQSGKLKSLRAHAVYEKDEFFYSLGDVEEIKHLPYNGDDDPGAIVAGYAIAVLDNDEIQREVVLKRDIASAQNASKSPNGPAWKNFRSEMVRKFAVHRISKYVPSTSDDADWLARQLDNPDGRTIDVPNTATNHGQITANDLTGEPETETVATSDEGTKFNTQTGEITDAVVVEETKKPAATTETKKTKEKALDPFDDNARLPADFWSRDSYVIPLDRFQPMRLKAAFLAAPSEDAQIKLSDDNSEGLANLRGGNSEAFDDIMAAASERATALSKRQK